MKEKRFIGLTDDLLFKESFSHVDNREALENFLEVVLKLEEGYLHNKLNVSYESVLNKNKYEEKSMRGDIIINYDDTTINLEAYSYFNYEALEKSTCYVMRIFGGLDKGEEYKNIEQVIQINLIDEVHTKIGREVINEYKITNTVEVEDKIMSDRFSIKYLRIDKARDKEYNEDDRLTRWLKFIGAKSEEEREMIAKGDKILMEFNEWVNRYINDEETKRKFDEWNYRVAISQGLEQGEEKAMLDVAKEMLKDNIALEQISKYTGLSIEEIENLK